MSTFQDYRATLTDTDAHLYRHSEGKSSYQRDEGLLVIPVMGPAGTAPAVVRVHAPVGYRMATFRAAKSSMPPIFPPQADTTSGDKILTSEVVFPLPRPNEDGTLTFGVSGEYTYVQPAGGRGPDDTYPMGRHPYPTMLDKIDTLPPPDRNAFGDLGWHWNVSYYDARLSCSYDLIA